MGDVSPRAPAPSVRPPGWVVVVVLFFVLAFPTVRFVVIVIVIVEVVVFVIILGDQANRELKVTGLLLRWAKPCANR